MFTSRVIHTSAAPILSCKQILLLHFAVCFIYSSTTVIETRRMFQKSHRDNQNDGIRAEINKHIWRTFLVFTDNKRLIHSDNDNFGEMLVCCSGSVCLLVHRKDCKANWNRPSLGMDCNNFDNPIKENSSLFQPRLAVDFRLT